MISNKERLFRSARERQDLIVLLTGGGNQRQPSHVHQTPPTSILGVHTSYHGSHRVIEYYPWVVGLITQIRFDTLQPYARMNGHMKDLHGSVIELITTQFFATIPHRCPAVDIAARGLSVYDRPERRTWATEIKAPLLALMHIW